MAEESFEKGDRVRHRDAPPDGPVGTILDWAGDTADGKPMYHVGFRSPTGATNVTRYPVDSLVRAEEPAGG